MDSPRTITGKRPSTAALQRDREFMDWQASLRRGRDDEETDDSWTAFMAARRVRKERERLSKRTERRREQRSQQRGQPAVPKLRPAAEPTPYKEPSRLQQDWVAHCESVGESLHDCSARKQFVYDRQLSRQRAAYAAKQAARGKVVIDAATRRKRKQQQQQRDDEERERRAESDRRYARFKECERLLRPYGIKHRGRDADSEPFWDVPSYVKPPDWMLSPDYDGYEFASEWRVLRPLVPAPWGLADYEVVKRGPLRDEAGRWVSSGWDDDGARYWDPMARRWEPPTRWELATGKLDNREPTRWLEGRGACEKTGDDGMESDSDGSLWESCSGM